MNYLETKIEVYRKKMYKNSNKYGFTSPQAIECSQQLDQLLYLLQAEKEKKKLTK
jgi:hypothetical protein